MLIVFSIDWAFKPSKMFLIADNIRSNSKKCEMKALQFEIKRLVLIQQI